MIGCVRVAKTVSFPAHSSLGTEGLNFFVVGGNAFFVNQPFDLVSLEGSQPGPQIGGDRNEPSRCSLGLGGRQATYSPFTSLHSVRQISAVRSPEKAPMTRVGSREGGAAWSKKRRALQE